MSAKVILCECPVCAKEFKARHDQYNAAVLSGREVPCCSHKCDRERRYSAYRDAKWQQEQAKFVNGLDIV